MSSADVQIRHPLNSTYLNVFKPNLWEPCLHRPAFTAMINPLVDLEKKNKSVSVYLVQSGKSLFYFVELGMKHIKRVLLQVLGINTSLFAVVPTSTFIRVSPLNRTIAVAT